MLCQSPSYLEVDTYNRVEVPIEEFFLPSMRCLVFPIVFRLLFCSDVCRGRCLYHTSLLKFCLFNSFFIQKYKIRVEKIRQHKKTTACKKRIIFQWHLRKIVYMTKNKLKMQFKYIFCTIYTILLLVFK